MPSRFFFPLVLLLLPAAACKPSPVATAVDAAASPVIAKLDDAGKNTAAEDARALVDAWVTAQNEAAFPKYEALYAPRFEGIRRSGEQVAKLDRTRWMRERRRMFGQKPTVTVKDVVVTPLHDGGAEVRFVQTWASDAYRDEGPKRMILVRSGDAVDGGSSTSTNTKRLLIAREEMLASTVMPQGSAPSEDKFAFAIAGGAMPMVVIAREAKDDWVDAASPPKVTSMDLPVTTRRSVSLATLPAALSAWKGKRVELFGKNGVVCEGTATSLAVIGRVTPHFGTVGRWRGVPAGIYAGAKPGDPPPPPEEIAEEAWSLSEGATNGRSVVAEIKSAKDSGDCSGALWGRVVDPAIAAKPPTFVEGKPADAATKARALAELRKTKAYADAQAQYVTERVPSNPARFEDYDANVRTHVFTHPSGTTIVTLVINAGAGCGSFGATLSAVFVVGTDGTTLSLLHDPVGDDMDPVSVGDVDGDGHVDLIEKEGLMLSTPRGDKLHDRTKLFVPDLDCGC